MKMVIIRVVSYTILITTTIVLGIYTSKFKASLDIAVNNEKAYVRENSILKNQNIVFKHTINNLYYSCDSLTREMKRVANDNGIKDRRIKALQYQLEHFSKRDTVFISDTIFKEKEFILDTCIIDSWNKSCLYLAYPNTITLYNEYNNEKYITLNSHKEPIKPRKWFLTRWFTPKHIIVEVLVVDKNPYVTTPKQRYIEIIND